MTHGDFESGTYGERSFRIRGIQGSDGAPSYCELYAEEPSGSRLLDRMDGVGCRGLLVDDQRAYLLTFRAA